tara:strand:- start:2443 stop:4215 length:1773 start_codon:yes stop_codon:yes gene_type:complete
MKHKRLITLSVFMLIAMSLASLMASANLVVDESYTGSNPTFGDENQEVSNPEHDDDDDQIINDTASITLTNNDTTESLTVTGISFTSNGQFDLSASDFFISTNPGAIAVAASAELVVSGKMPKDLDAIDSNFKEVAFEVGTMTVTADYTNGTSVSTSFSVFMQRENQLIIDDFDAKVNLKTAENNIEDGDDVKDLSPGDKVELQITLESRYNDNDNIDIEDIDLDFVCDDDNDLDIDDDNIDVGDMGPDDQDTESINFDIEDDAKDETLNCFIETSGKDENGAVHGEKINFDLEIDRNNHDIVIKQLTVSPLSLTCEDTLLQITIDAVNLGKSDEDEVAFQILSATLGINEKISNLELDEDDTIIETLTVSVDPASIKEGTYAIQAQSFYDTTKTSDSKIVQVENLCSTLSAAEEAAEQTGEFYNQVSVKDSAVSISSGKTASVEVTLTNSGTSSADYVVSLDNLGDIGESTGSKTVHLNPDQSATVFLNFKTTDNIEEGTYTATVALTDANTGATLETETFTVEIEEGAKKLDAPGALFRDTSNALWVVLIIILVVIAVFLIKMIFSGSSQSNPKAKKLADFEPVKKKK